MSRHTWLGAQSKAGPRRLPGLLLAPQQAPQRQQITYGFSTPAFVALNERYPGRADRVLCAKAAGVWRRCLRAGQADAGVF